MAKMGRVPSPDGGRQLAVRIAMTFDPEGRRDEWRHGVEYVQTFGRRPHYLAQNCRFRDLSFALAGRDPKSFLQGSSWAAFSQQPPPSAAFERVCFRDLVSIKALESAQLSRGSNHSPR
jgi:hypothetical protein